VSSPYLTFRFRSIKLHALRSISSTNRILACDGHTLKATFVISWKPSLSWGGLYREVKPLNAMLGRIVRFSGFICDADQNELHMPTQIAPIGVATFVGMNWGMVGKGAHTTLFRARTTSLCSQSSELAVNNTQRIGTECFAARSTHLLRTSESALVLSRTRKSSEHVPS
jgi:hypothetical protein